MYQEISQLLMYGDMDENEILYKLGQLFARFEKGGYEKMSICIVKGNDNAGNLYRKLGARHYKDFTGKMSHSEKLLWDDLSVFE